MFSVNFVSKTHQIKLTGFYPVKVQHWVEKPSGFYSAIPFFNVCTHYHFLFFQILHNIFS